MITFDSTTYTYTRHDLDLLKQCVDSNDRLASGWTSLKNFVTGKAWMKSSPLTCRLTNENLPHPQSRLPR
jgi:hypothetical protein